MTSRSWEPTATRLVLAAFDAWTRVFFWALAAKAPMSDMGSLSELRLSARNPLNLPGRIVATKHQ